MPPRRTPSNRLAKAIAALLRREPYRSLVPAEAAKVWDATQATAAPESLPEPPAAPAPPHLSAAPAGPRVDHARDEAMASYWWDHDPFDPATVAPVLVQPEPGRWLALAPETLDLMQAWNRGL